MRVKMEISLTVDGKLRLSLVPANGVLGSADVDAVIGCTCSFDLQTPVVQYLQPVTIIIIIIIFILFVLLM